MKKLFTIFSISGLIFIGAVSNLALAAGSNYSQRVTVRIVEINELTVSGNPSALIINFANAGSQPASAVNSTTFYSISSNGSSKKITGALNSNMPANTSLTINLAAPVGATSMGAVSLSKTAADLVTGISKVAESGKTITYTFSASVTAGVVSAGTRTVTLTITNLK